MTGPADPLGSPASPAQPTPAETHPADSASPPAAAPAEERPVHLYQAADAQRERVLSAFDSQRAAILKAVADQRAAAMAPILAVQAKRAVPPRPAPMANAPMPTPTAPAPPGISEAIIGPRGRLAGMADPRRAIAAQIVETLKMLVAAEVRAQLAALSSSNSPQDARRSASGDPDPAIDADGGPVAA
jgi:hypothetical protein